MRKRIYMRKIIIPLIILLLFVVIFVLFKFLEDVTKYKVFVFNKENFLLYQESNKEWFDIKKSEFVKKYGDKAYTLYVGNKNITGKFKFGIVSNNLEMINRSNDIVTRYTEENWFAYAGSSKVNYIKFIEASFSVDDEKIVFNRLKKKGLSNDYNVSYSKKYIFNLDNDMDRESIYIVSNMSDDNKKNINKESDKLFTFMFLVDRNKIYDIYSKVVSQEDVDKLCIPSFDAVLDFSDSNSYKFISYCDYVSKNSYELDLYNYQNNRFSFIKVNN